MEQVNRDNLIKELEGSLNIIHSKNMAAENTILGLIRENLDIKSQVLLYKQMIDNKEKEIEELHRQLMREKMGLGKDKVEENVAQDDCVELDQAS